MKRLLLAAVLLMGGGVRAADTVVVVLDASGSMDEKIALKTGQSIEKMKVAKLALVRTLLNLPENTQVGILVFSASNLQYNEEWVYPVAKINKKILADAIQKPLPGGGTPLGEYIKKGADALLEARARNKDYGTYTEVVVTDGQATDGALVEQNVPLVMARGIRLNVIGLDVQPDSFLANRVSSYQSANDLDSLTTAVKNAIAEVPAGKDGKIDASWFSEIEPLPSQVAQYAILALNTTISQNQPIGEKPKPTVQVASQSTTTAPSQLQETAPSEGMGVMGWIGVVFVVGIVVGGGIVVVRRML